MNEHENELDVSILFEGYGMSIKQVSDYFEVPYRTVQDWKLGNRKCTDYLLKLMIYKLENEKKNK